ncbi:MAG: ParB/RepB/Spo0J family partition protein [Desulfobulbaceae bacterium]|nr:ParB/RepB/Spo0J family partition protein [Desulfobulbaceae bacterium]
MNFRSKKTNEEVKELPIEKVVDPAFVARTQFDHDKMIELCDSIKEVGLIEPIIVKEIPGGWEVVAGHRRRLACNLLELPTIRAIVMSDTRRSELIKYHENAFREDLNPIDEAREISHIMQIDETLTSKEVARHLGKSEAYVSQRLAILDYDEVLFNALKDGQLSFSVARELAKITDIPAQQSFVTYAITGGCSPQMARNWYQGWRQNPEVVPSTEPGNGGSQIYVPPAPLVVCQACRSAIHNPLEVSSLVVCASCKGTIIEAMNTN